VIKAREDDVATRAKKDAHLASLRTPPHPVPNQVQPIGTPPAQIGTPFNPPIDVLNPILSDPIGANEFSGVEFLPLNVFRTVPVTAKNSFWTALSCGVCGDADRWPIYKLTVRKYLDLAMNYRNGHPRYALYRILERSLPNDLVAQAADVEVPTTVEMVQVAADVFSLEIFVIQAAHNNSLTTRGQHNAKQIFFRLLEDGTWQTTYPLLSSVWDWRFIEHIPDQATRQRQWEFATDLDKVRSPVVELPRTTGTTYNGAEGMLIGAPVPLLLTPRFIVTAEEERHLRDWDRDH